jgi:hypothetical protein
MRASSVRAWIFGAALAVASVWAVSVSAGERAGEGAHQSQKAGAVGYLNVSSVPPANVMVDDQDTHQTTPVEKMALPEGDHKLTLVSLDKKVVRTLGFKIVSGQTTRLKINL